MKRYQDLFIHLPSSGIEGFISDLGTSLPKHWRRDSEKEASLPHLSERKMYCFQRSLEDGLDSSLWLVEKDDKTLFVSNIVPTEKPELSITEYNIVLKNFVEKCLANAIEKHKGKSELTSEEYSLDDLINKDAAKALRVFSSCANKSTGSSHPNDRERWFAFLSIAYKDRNNLPPEEVEKFLIEDGWSGSFAVKLAIEYEFGSGLLEYAEVHDVL